MEKEIGRIVSAKIDEAAKKGIKLSGRRLLRFIYIEYEVEEDIGALFAIQDVMAVELVGEESGLGCLYGVLGLHSVMGLANQMKSSPCDTLHEQIAACKCIEQELGIHTAAALDDYKSFYTHLEAAVRMHIDKHKRASTR